MSIAIIGMSGRFPGARDIEEFWQNLCSGKETVKSFTAEELIKAGIPEAVVNDPNYVKASPVLDNIEMFDADFFKYTRREAEFLDPQQRFFLECTWEALEQAGYAHGTYRGSIGVYAGSGGAVTSYLLACLDAHPEIRGATGSMQHLANDKDFLSTRVSYELDLKGPSVNIQTACSTSLVAVHMACQAINSGECDMALAGGVSIRIPHTSGYMRQDGDIFSEDGHIRTFDAKATGILFGSGVGVVVLKPLEYAIRDRDVVYAVIKGSAINNDGAKKVSYTASGLKGQSQCMAEAFAVAKVDPETVTYVEAHGTGTAMGDPIEIAALSQVFPKNKKQYCAVASVKTNIGHLDVTSGIAGLIKVALSLHHKKIPASINYDTPNPKIDFANSPFFVNTQLKEWESPEGTPRRAAVNSLGMGGTNAFAVLEEFEPMPKMAEEHTVQRPNHILCFSGKAEGAVSDLADRYIGLLGKDDGVKIEDICYMAGAGRSHFRHRLAVRGSSKQDILAKLKEYRGGATVPSIVTGAVPDEVTSKLVFMFTGEGSQYAAMGKKLYRTEPTFKSALKECDQILDDLIGQSVLSILFEDDPRLLNKTLYTQPAMFAFEYAVSKLWEKWGIKPAAVIGHSSGELAAACYAGVFSLEDGLKLSTIRARLMNSVPGDGGMVAVFAHGVVVAELLEGTAGVSIAAYNGPQNTVISGLKKDLAPVLELLHEKGLAFRALEGSLALHSDQLAPILDELQAEANKIRFSAPKTKIISNVTGIEASLSLIGNGMYWRNQAREGVRFSDGIAYLTGKGHRIFLEVGPGNTLCSMARLVDPAQKRLVWLQTVNKGKDDSELVCDTLSQLYINGIEPSWQGLNEIYPEISRVSLPTYPFQREKYWVKSEKPAPIEIAAPAPREPDRRSAARPAPASPLLSKLGDALPDDRRALLIEALQAELALEIGAENPRELDPKKGFMDLGLNSLQGVGFRNQLIKVLGGVGLRKTVMFDYPNIEALAEFLLATVLKFEKTEAVATPGIVSAAVAEAHPNEAIAIVGASCRLPGGVHDLNSYWNVLRNGIDGITEVPKDRWDINKYYSKDPDAAGKVNTRFGGFIDGVDKFDAEFFEMTAREAVDTDPQQRFLLEVAWEALEVAGISPASLRNSRTGVFVGATNFDYGRILKGDDLSGFFGIGTLLPALAGRISYFFGFQGPAMVIDTACSSSLTGIHLACASLRTRESDLALAGGVNMILDPAMSISTSRAQMLSPTGHCHSFDASADGYIRSEGCALVVLKRLSDAVKDGDSILGVIRGSLVNQDGRSSTITAPNGPSQEALLRETLRRALVRPGDVDYYEAHGTGTPLGDPIEVGAIGQVMSEGRKKPLFLGSHKASIGHTEAVAGVSGVIKLVLAMKNSEIPPQIHFSELNPAIVLDQIPAQITTRVLPWPNGHKLAAINSFGFTGTNACAILESAPAVENKASDFEPRREHILTLSARTAAGLDELLATYANHLQQSPDDIADICYTASVGRTHFKERIALVAKTKEELIQKLSGANAADRYRGRAKSAPKIAVVMNFSDQTAMALGHELMKVHPAFKSAVDECANILKRPAAKIFPQSAGAADATTTFVFGYSLYKMINSFGFDPLAILGVGLSELVAACVGGALTLQEAIMLAPADHSFFNQSAFLPLKKRVVSSVTGELVDFQKVPAAYWADHAGGKINLPKAVQTLSAEGCTAFLELGDLNLTYPEEAQRWVLSPKAENAWGAALHALAAAYSHGAEINWTRFESGNSRRKVALPTYPFQRRRFWFAEQKPVYQDAHYHPLLGIVVAPASHGDEVIYQNNVTLETIPQFIKDHVIYNQVMLPGTGYIEMALSGLRERNPNGTLALQSMTVDQPVVILPGEEKTLQMVLREESADSYSFQIFSNDQGEEAEEWRLHASGNAALKNEKPSASANTLQDVQRRCPKEISAPQLYASLAKIGIQYGPMFQGVQKLFTGTDECLGLVVLPEPLHATAGEYNLHPSLLDACQHVASAPLVRGESDPLPCFLPVSYDEIVVHRQPPTRVWCHVLTRAGGKIGDKTYKIDMHVYDEEWKLVAEVTGASMIDATQNSVSSMATQTAADNMLYETKWKERTLGSVPADTNPGHWLIFADRHGLGEKVARDIVQSGGTAKLVPLPAAGLENLEWYVGLIKEAVAEHKKVDHVVHLWNLDCGQKFLAPGDGLDISADEIQDEHKIAYGSVLHLAQALLNAAVDENTELTIVTRSGQPTDTHAGQAISVSQASVWGLGKVIELEFPELNCRRVDLDANINLDQDAKTLTAEILAGTEEQVAYRKGTRLAARLNHFQGKVIPIDRARKNFQSDASYLVTGGLGGLGLELLKWMAEQGARSLVIVSRSEPGTEARKVIAQLESQGVRMTLVRKDISLQSEVAELVQEMTGKLPPLKGVLHLAGVLADSGLLQQDWEKFRKVMAPKIRGAWNLHLGTQHLKLDFFVCFSSTAAVMGNRGQANYAAANAFMDAFAFYRRSKGQPALSVNWGPWAEIGMASSDASIQRQLAEQGIDLLPLKEGLDLLGELMSSEIVQVGVMK